MFWSGVFFLLLSVFNIRTAIVKAIPRPLRHAVAAGIGLFITLIGLANEHGSNAVLVVRAGDGFKVITWIGKSYGESLNYGAAVRWEF